jgi:hypothetical protein
MTMKKAGIITLLVLALITACTPKEAGTPTASVDDIYTMAAETVITELTLTAAVTTPTRLATATMVAAEKSATPVPTSLQFTETPIVTNTPLAQPSQTPEAAATDEFCDDAAWVADVSVQDGTEMSPGQAFEKTWRIKNTGTCTWNANYKIAFGYGEYMTGQARALDYAVNPGENIEVTVVFAAPLNPGSYQSYWRMVNTSGVNFGEWLYVDIVVR